MLSTHLWYSVRRRSRPPSNHRWAPSRLEDRRRRSGTGRGARRRSPSSSGPPVGGIVEQVTCKSFSIPIFPPPSHSTVYPKRPASMRKDRGVGARRRRRLRILARSLSLSLISWEECKGKDRKLRGKLRRRREGHNANFRSPPLLSLTWWLWN